MNPTPKGVQKQSPVSNEENKLLENSRTAPTPQTAKYDDTKAYGSKKTSESPAQPKEDVGPGWTKDVGPEWS